MSLACKNNILLIFFLMLSGLAAAQLSPGELSEAHAHLEGLTNCTKCHILGEKETTSKCLACHTEMKSLIGQGRGLHATATRNQKECHSCHGEHFGRSFQIVRFEKDTFNHRLTNYDLEGKHAGLECTACHKTELIQTGISQKKGFTWLGLGTKCLDCHADVHRNTLSDDCLSCHNQTAFRPAPGFDHAKTGFPLAGKHRIVACQSCHKINQNDSKDFLQYNGVTYTKCTDCHADVHQGKFGYDCRKCHNEFSFRQVSQLVTFNHDLTGYPLQGKHIAVDCKKCHKGSGYTSPVKHQRCTDCHSDYHRGQFLTGNLPRDCSSCHTLNGFLPSSFTLEQHNQGSFELDGAHLATPCFACHKKTGEWNFRGIGNRCTDCHYNIHSGYLDNKYLEGGDCKNCHSSLTWGSVKFNHNETGFLLEGKHARAACRQCHFPENSGQHIQRFAWDNNSCTNCHEDIHFGQFGNNSETSCARCHSLTGWTPVNFNHDNARFKLDGRHTGLACSLCHKPADNLKNRFIVYKFEDISCESCH